MTSTIDAARIEDAASDLLSALYAADDRHDGFKADHAPVLVAALADCDWTTADVLAFGEDSELAGLLPESARDREHAEGKARGISDPWRVLRTDLLSALEPRANQATEQEDRDIAAALGALDLLPGLLRSCAPKGAAQRKPSSFANVAVEAPKMLPGTLGAMVYAEGATVFYGEPEHGKSLAGQTIAVEAMAAGLKVVHLDGEQGEQDAGANYHAVGADLGINPAEMASLGLLHYEYDDAIGFDAEYVAGLRPDVVLVDSFARLAQARGIGDGQYAAQGNLMSELQAFGIRNGCAVVVIDHAARNADDRYAVGGGSKLAAARGQWKVKRERKFTPDKAGVVSFTNTKARRAGVPSWLRFEAGGEGGQRFSFRRTLDKTVPVDRIELDVLEFARSQGRPLSQNAIRKGVEGKNGAIDDATARLVGRGVMRKVQTGAYPKYEAVPET